MTQNDDLLSLDAQHGDPERRRPRHRRTVWLVLSGLFLVLALLPTAGAWLLSERYAGNVQRIPDAMPADDPAGSAGGLSATGSAAAAPAPGVAGDPAAAGAQTDAALLPRPTRPQSGAGKDSLNILLVGSDARSAAPTTGQGAGGGWRAGAQRTDTIMLLHLSDDRREASVVSLPRDSWVDVPGHGMNKINAAYSLGGPPLLIRTVEALTRVRIDHVAAIDFQGFEQMTDALGGVTVPTANGPQHLNGQDALTFVRTRYSLPGGDFGRVQRQQAFLRSVAEQATTGSLANPLKLDKFLTSVTDTVSVDAGLSDGDLRKLVFGLRNMRRGDVDFLTAPYSGVGQVGDQSVVFLDRGASAALWKALLTDDVPRFLATHSVDVLGPTVR